MKKLDRLPFFNRVVYNTLVWTLNVCNAEKSFFNITPPVIKLCELLSSLKLSDLQDFIVRVVIADVYNGGNSGRVKPIKQPSPDTVTQLVTKN